MKKEDGKASRVEREVMKRRPPTFSFTRLEEVGVGMGMEVDKWGTGEGMDVEREAVVELSMGYCLTEHYKERT